MMINTSAGSMLVISYIIYSTGNQKVCHFRNHLKMYAKARVMQKKCKRLDERWAIKCWKMCYDAKCEMWKTWELMKFLIIENNPKLWIFHFWYFMLWYVKTCKRETGYPAKSMFNVQWQHTSTSYAYVRMDWREKIPKTEKKNQILIQNTHTYTHIKHVLFNSFIEVSQYT